MEPNRLRPMGKTLTLYFVTGNRNKYEEAREVLERELPPETLEFHPIEVEKLEIQSERLDKIALFAARHAYSIVRHPLLVEDSGLFVKALRGFPGPYSSYVFEKLGLSGILKLMEDSSDRSAYFETAIAVIIPPYEKVFKGRVDGIIARQIRGNRGFGFDPIFEPNGAGKTFAEMSISEKNLYSHRSQAFRKLAQWLKTLMQGSTRHTGSK